MNVVEAKSPDVNFSGLLDGSPWPVLALSKCSGQIILANSAMKELYLSQAGEPLMFENCFLFEGGHRLGAIVKRMLATGTWKGRVVPLENRLGIESVELMLKQDAGDADQIWAYAMEHPVVDGAVRFSSRSEFQLLQVLLDNTLEYVFFRNPKGHFILTNRAFRDAVVVGGADRGRLSGRTIADFVYPQSAKWVEAIDAQVFGSGLPSINQVAHFMFKNGTGHWLQMTTVPVRNGSGAIVGTVSVARDISDLKETETELRKAIERAQEASRSKGEFLAAMSHEIRTPINGIIGAAELCQETKLNIEQSGYLKTVMQCSGTLLTLVSDVLDLSKIESGLLELEKIHFNPKSLIREVVDEFEGPARRKKLKLLVDCHDDLPNGTLGDPTRLKQILYNLVGNAVKFTEKGGITIKAECLECAKQKAKLRLSVIDTGVGVAESRLEAIFGDFTQADLSTNRKFGGSGLGLAITRRLVELMGGIVSVKSKEGVGSTFFVEIVFELGEFSDAAAISPVRNCKNPDGTSEGRPAATEKNEPDSQPTLFILLAEDNQVNQKIAQIRLEKMGHRVKVVANGRQAVDAVRKGTFDCILMDVQMPELDGYEATRQIRAMEAQKGVPRNFIIAMTAHVMRGDEEACTAVGMDAYLAKPFRAERLREVLSRVEKSSGRSDFKP